ncbi:MAG: tetratricopeptide repeat protein [Bryobacteraceae bacterium]
MFLFLATFAVYAQVRHFDFVNFDDPEYVTANPHVRTGITAANVAWAFASGEAANWFPLTRLSHMLDCQMFGLRSGWHHLTNVLLHALAVLLLFAFLNRSTGRRWPSAWVALLFALHPLHVESVAWVAERKDSLSAFFGLLALWSYVRYVERPATRRYLLVVLAFALGLMAKPMLVTLPVVMLLVDVWPLGRVTGMGPSPPGPGVGTSADAARMSACATRNGLLREKIPFFALAAAAAGATYLVQQAGGAVRSSDAFPLVLRLENALVSYIIYIAKMFWPARLAVFYPYPSEVPAWQAAAAALAIAVISILVARSVRKRPYLAVGWFWYLVTLAPVIGLVQVGAQARADRYTYIPMIGLTIMLAWGAADLLGRVRRAKPAIAALATATCACCAALTWVQAGYWRDSRTLFQHAVDVTDGNYLAHHNLGAALAETPGGLNEAIAHYQAALRIKPGYARAHTDLGSALARLPGRLPDAMAEFRAALAIDPDLAIPHNNLGNALAQAGRWNEAVSEYGAALRIDPDYADARHNLAEAQYNLGFALAKTDGRAFEAIAHLEAALRLRPDYPEAHNNLGVVLSQAPGRLSEAIAHFQAALQLDPDYADAHINLGVALSQMPGRLPEAIAQLEAAERIQPDAEVRGMIERLKAQKK